MTRPFGPAGAMGLRLRGLLAEFERGCGVAGPRSGHDKSDPFTCEECAAVFVRAVRGVVAARGAPTACLETKGTISSEDVERFRRAWQGIPFTHGVDFADGSSAGPSQTADGP